MNQANTKVVAKGSVGERADTCVLQARNDIEGSLQAVVQVTAANLCHSHGAVATVLQNGELKVSGVDLNDSKMRIESELEPGERLVVVVQLVDRRNGIVCLRLGETKFELHTTPVAASQDPSILVPPA